MPKNKYPLDVKSVGGDTYIVMMSRPPRSWNLGGAQHVWIKTTPAKGRWNYSIVDQNTRDLLLEVRRRV